MGLDPNEKTEMIVAFSVNLIPGLVAISDYLNQVIQGNIEQIHLADILFGLIIFIYPITLILWKYFNTYYPKLGKIVYKSIFIINTNLILFAILFFVMILLLFKWTSNVNFIVVLCTWLGVFIIINMKLGAYLKQTRANFYLYYHLLFFIGNITYLISIHIILLIISLGFHEKYF